MLPSEDASLPPSPEPRRARAELRLVTDLKELGPITPELALIDPELAKAARAALPPPGWLARSGGEARSEPPREPPVGRPAPAPPPTIGPAGPAPRRVRVDTSDGRLRRYGISLERRLRRTRTTWKLVLPRGETVVAEGETLPAHVVSLLGGVVGERPLEAVPWYREDPDFARLEAYVAEQRDAMLAHDPGVRLGADPENLHLHRVAARRLRAALRTARRLVDPGWSESLRRELSALGRVTGPLRDLDVLLEWLEEERRRLPSADAEGGEALTAELEARRADLQAELLSILDGEGYRGLLVTLEQPVAPAPAAARRTLRDRVARDVSRLIADVQSAGRRPGTDALHELRLAVKRVRYSVELAGAGGGSRAARLTAAARELQDILGAYQDTVSAEELLRGEAIRSRNGALAFAAGTLTARQRGRRKRLARDLPAAWKQLRRAARSS